MVRLKKVSNSGCLQDREPVLGSIDGDMDVPAQIGQIQQLAGARRGGSKKTEKSHLITDPGQIANVALQIGLNVGAIEQIPVDLRG